MRRKKIILASIVILIFICSHLTTQLSHLVKSVNKYTYIPNTDIELLNLKKIDREHGNYDIFQNSKYIGSFTLEQDAIAYAKLYDHTIVKNKQAGIVIWDNYPAFNVFTDDSNYIEFISFAEASIFAENVERSYIYYRKNNALIWNSSDMIEPSSIIENIPLILQNPELPRGCEVTSLAMLLSYLGVTTDKLELADKVTKDNTPYEIKNGKVYFGNPNDGFVGDIKNKLNRGFGVYHEPIYRLLKEYLPNNAIDLTGADFKFIEYFLHNKTPVWVIINTTFKRLPENSFLTWITPSGEIKITYYEHSVLLTGYDENNVYFNDPLDKNQNKSAPKKEFIDAWVQMGSQGVSYCK